jgi:hypothetical protein
MFQILKFEAVRDVSTGNARSLRAGRPAAKTMRRWRQLLLGAAAVLASGVSFSQAAMADDTADKAKCDPYKDYSCLDSYLGDGVITRMFNYYKLEWGQAGPPTDPNAPPSRRDNWPATPETIPPMPFTEWPYGGTQNLGVTRPNSADSPLMVGLGATNFGHWLNDSNIQIYGWLDPGFNISSNNQRPGGNFPIAYSYTPNTVQLDQAVLYIERVPDTVQKDHIDWGFRISGIYGENYRYTTAYGIASYQLLHENNVYGYDFPMMYFELFVPQIGEGGTDIRIGRFISLPDIEAQLAPNNYMYSHSLTYGYDNYTNEGIQTTIGITKNFFLQLGVTVGTEAPPWHWDKTMPNPDPNPLFPGKTMKVDPGAQPSGTACIRYTTDSGNDNVNACADAINRGNWGYNNLQWYGLTYYHRFDEHWHISTEAYWEHQNNVLNLNNPVALAAYLAGGTPFSPQYTPFNAPSLAQCSTPVKFSCTANAIGGVAYINYSPDPLDNISFRPEIYDDAQGQRTGTKTSYVEFSIGWQHWLSPQIEFRPEIGWYQSLNAPAFNGNSNAGIPANRNTTLIGQSDVIIHF